MLFLWLASCRLPGHCQVCAHQWAGLGVFGGLHKPVWTNASQGKEAIQRVGTLSWFFCICHSCPSSTWALVLPSPGAVQLLYAHGMPHCLAKGQLSWVLWTLPPPLAPSALGSNGFLQVQVSGALPSLHTPLEAVPSLNSLQLTPLSMPTGPC